MAFSISNSPPHKFSKGMGKGDMEAISSEGAMTSSAAPPAWWAAAEAQLIGKLEARFNIVEEQVGEMKQGLAAVWDHACSAVSKAEKAGVLASQCAEEIRALRVELNKSVQTKPQCDEDLKHKIQELENKVNKTVIYNSRSSTALFGGLGESTFEEAKSWVKEYLTQQSIGLPTDMYHKGESFSGIIFL